jgi:sulfide:quinone oxidoreductase
VALPRLAGVPIDGLPATRDGLIRTDAFGRVENLVDVYAAGDITAFPAKQGGIAAEQADAVAEMLASEAGADVTPRPFEPVLRGVLMTGKEDRFLRAELAGGRGSTGAADSRALWWPPAKVAGRYLAPYLAALEVATTT